MDQPPAEHLHVTNVMRDALVIEIEKNSKGHNYRLKIDRSLRPGEEFSDAERDALAIVDRLHGELSRRFDGPAPAALAANLAPAAALAETVVVAKSPEAAKARLAEIAREFDAV